MNHSVRRRRALGVLLGALICQMGLGYGYTLSALAGDILGELDWSRVTYSGARAPQIFVIALASPLIGAATVRFGSRRILACAAGVLGVAFVLLSRFDSLWQLYGIVLLMGLAVAGLGDVSVSHVVSRWFQKRRGLALGIVFTGSNLGGFFLTRFSGGRRRRRILAIRILCDGPPGLLRAGACGALAGSRRSHCRSEVRPRGAPRGARLSRCARRSANAELLDPRFRSIRFLLLLHGAARAPGALPDGPRDAGKRGLATGSGWPLAWASSRKSPSAGSPIASPRARVSASISRW